ncbi:MAG: flagellar motor switch protein FliN [Pseudomonadota bacterium]
MADDFAIPGIEETAGAAATHDEAHGGMNAADLESVFDVPVRVSAILGHTRIPVSELLRLDEGVVLELDRKVGESIDLYVNNRLVARGEVVMVEDKLGVTMTEIIDDQK